MKGFKSALILLKDISNSSKIKNDFKYAIDSIRTYFPNCDFYIADGLSPPRISVGINQQDKRGMAADKCAFRFVYFPKEGKLYLNLNKRRKNQFAKALNAIGGLRSFSYKIKSRIKHGVSIDEKEKLKKLLKAVKKDKNLSELLSGSAKVPDDYTIDDEDSFSNKNPVLKTKTTRASVNQVDVFLRETGNFQPKFVKWLATLGIDKVNQQRKNINEKKPDVWFSKKDREIICELKWLKKSDASLKIRSAVGQLLEYRYFSGSDIEKVDLWLVLNKSPDKNYVQYLKSLKSEIGSSFRCYVFNKKLKSFKNILNG